MIVQTNKVTLSCITLVFNSVRTSESEEEPLTQCFFAIYCTISPSTDQTLQMDLWPNGKALDVRLPLNLNVGQY